MLEWNSDLKGDKMNIVGILSSKMDFAFSHLNSIISLHLFSWKFCLHALQKGSCAYDRFIIEISVGLGSSCFCEFLVRHAPQKEDAGFTFSFDSASGKTRHGYERALTGATGTDCKSR